jgi:hypothetical protein
VSRAKIQIRIYRSVDELPEILEPGKHIIKGEEVEIYEPVDKDTLVHDIRKVKECLKRYGKKGWV